MIAKVIVDVPLMQTDKPYSYQIPSEFEDMVEAGTRVHVPFGKGNRLIQGIVVDVLEEADPPCASNSKASRAAMAVSTAS